MPNAVLRTVRAAGLLLFAAGVSGVLMDAAPRVETRWIFVGVAALVAALDGLTTGLLFAIAATAVHAWMQRTGIPAQLPLLLSGAVAALAGGGARAFLRRRRPLPREEVDEDERPSATDGVELAPPLTDHEPVDARESSDVRTGLVPALAEDEPRQRAGAWSHATRELENDALQQLREGESTTAAAEVSELRELARAAAERTRGLEAALEEAERQAVLARERRAAMEAEAESARRAAAGAAVAAEKSAEHVARLEHQTLELQNELASMQRRLDSATRELEAAHERKLEEMRRSLTEAQDDAARSRGEVESLVRQLAEARASAAAAATERERSAEDAAGHRVAAATRELQVAHDSALQQVRAESDAAREEARAFARRVDELEGALAEARRDAEQGLILRSQESAAAAEAHLRSVVSELQVGHDAELLAANAAAEEARGESRRLARRIEELERLLAEVRITADEVTDERFRRLTSEADERLEAALASSKREHDEHLQSITREMEETRAESVRLARHGEELEGILLELRSAADEATNASDRERAENEARLRQHEAANAEAAERARIREVELTARVGALESEVDAQRRLAEQAEARAAEHLAARAAGDGATATLAGRILELEQQLAVLGQEAESARGELREVVARAAGADELRAHAESRLAESVQQSQAHFAHIGELERQNADLRTSLAAAEARSLGTSAEVTRLTAETRRLAQELDATKGRSVDQARRLAEIESSHSQLRQMANDALAEIAAGENRFATTRGELANVKERNAELERIVAALQETGSLNAAAAEESLSQARSEADAAAERIEELRREIAALKQDALTDRGPSADELALIRSEVESEREKANAARTEIEAQLATITSLRELLQAASDREQLLEGRIRAVQQEHDSQLQTIVTHLASDHEADLGQALLQREEARAEVRRQEMRVARMLRENSELRASLTREQEQKATLDAEWNAKLQTIVAHIASDHEADLGQAIVEREAAKAEVRRLLAKVAELTRALEARATSEGPAKEREIANLPKARILLVHPDLGVRVAAERALAQSYDVVTAADGLEALRIVMADRPAVVVAETQMPKMDGKELAQLLRSRDETAAIKTVLVNSSVAAGRGEDDLRNPENLRLLKATLDGILRDPA